MSKPFATKTYALAGKYDSVVQQCEICRHALRDKSPYNLSRTADRFSLFFSCLSGGIRIGHAAVVVQSDGRVPRVAPPAASGRRVHPRLTVDAGAAAILADCGLPLRGISNLRNGHQWWQRLMQRVVQPVVADLHDPAAASALRLRSYRPNTHRSYPRSLLLERTGSSFADGCDHQSFQCSGTNLSALC